MTVQLAPGTPESVEQELITQTTAQFNATVNVNQFFPNTYQIILQGDNTTYNPLVTNQQMLNAVVQEATSTYNNGWANGLTYQQNYDINLAANFDSICSTSTVFNGVQADTNTCVGIIAKIIEGIELLQYQDPVPPQPGDY